MMCYQMLIAFRFVFQKLNPKQSRCRSRFVHGHVSGMKSPITINFVHHVDFVSFRSDPTSSRFGAHLSQEQVIDYFKPKRDTIDSVGTWIEKTIKPGRIRLPHHKQWMGFDTSVSNLEQILHTKFYYYESSGTEGLEIGCDRYLTPQACNNL